MNGVQRDTILTELSRPTLALLNTAGERRPATQQT
jgi:hypothetical protein